MHIYEKSRPTGKVSGIMANTIELKQQIAQGEYDAAFTKLYGAAAVQEQRKRYTDLIDEFEKKYGTNRTVLEIVANNIHFCGSKAESAAPAGSPAAAAPAQSFAPVQEDWQLCEDEGDLPF